jgi:glycosyltransferase involved in cell wall biosynthesis
VRFFGFQPFAKIPEFLAISDLIVIPQKKDFATIGQMPAKVFDAMAMAKPIIATAVSGLPEVLADCGFIVEPESPRQLAKMIKYVFSHPQQAKKIAQKAREKCIQQYSWDALETTLANIFDRYKTS